MTFHFWLFRHTVFSPKNIERQNQGVATNPGEPGKPDNPGIVLLSLGKPGFFKFFR